PLSAPLLCSFLHSFAVRGNSSLFFSIPSALFTKTPGVYPDGNSLQLRLQPQSNKSNEDSHDTQNRNSRFTRFRQSLPLPRSRRSPLPRRGARPETRPLPQTCQLSPRDKTLRRLPPAPHPRNR